MICILLLIYCSSLCWILQIFAWLTLHNCLTSMRDRLAKRGVISEATCPFGCQTDNIPAHLYFICPHTLLIWHKFQIQNVQGLRTIQVTITNPRLIPPTQRKKWATIFIALAWNIWLSRNRMVFGNVNKTAWGMEECCWDTITLWANRSRKAERRNAIKVWVEANRIM
jgi:hypothetical protein